MMSGLRSFMNRLDRLQERIVERQQEYLNSLPVEMTNWKAELAIKLLPKDEQTDDFIAGLLDQPRHIPTLVEMVAMGDRDRTIEDKKLLRRMLQGVQND